MRLREIVGRNAESGGVVELWSVREGKESCPVAMVRRGWGMAVQSGTSAESLWENNSNR